MAENVSDITVNSDGVQSNTVAIPCPTCHRKGTVDNSKYFGQVMFYHDMNGNRVPQEKCRTCNGEGWVHVPLSEIIKNGKK